MYICINIYCMWVSLPYGYNGMQIKSEWNNEWREAFWTGDLWTLFDVMRTKEGKRSFWINTGVVYARWPPKIVCSLWSKKQSRKKVLPWIWITMRTKTGMESEIKERNVDYDNGNVTDQAWNYKSRTDTRPAQHRRMDIHLCWISG